MAASDYPIEICRGFTTHQWRELFPRLRGDDPEAWECAIDVFRRRLGERYLSSIEALIAADSRLDSTAKSESGDCESLPQDETEPVVPGFAITALCCLLVETLQSFREGSSANTKQQFKRFLDRDAFRGEFAGTSFATDVRNKIFHLAETRNWIILRTNVAGKIVETRADGRCVLYRNQFFDAIRQELNDYVAELQSEDSPLRPAFLKRMDKVATGS